MIRKIVALFFVFMAGLCYGQQVKMKMIYFKSERHRLYILPIGYDSNLSDEKIAACIDTLHGHLFGAKMYNLLYKGDTTKLAVSANEGHYFFHKRLTINILWKNGNKKEIVYINKHYKKYWQFNFYDNDAPASFGHYKEGHKVKKWKYFNTDSKKVRVEKYGKDGTVKKSKTFDPPKKTLKAMFNTKHPGGTEYIIN